MKRIHVAADRLTEEEAGLFLVSSLLVSHGVRTDTEAWVRIGRTWIVASGSSIRQLRPDPVSAEAWVKAVAYKGKASRLGARLAGQNQAPPTGPCVGPRGRTSLKDIVGAGQGSTIVLWYGEECSDAGLQMDRLRVWLMPALANIIIDRIEAGLPA